MPITELLFGIMVCRKEIMLWHSRLFLYRFQLINMKSGVEILWQSNVLCCPEFLTRNIWMFWKDDCTDLNQLSACLKGNTLCNSRLLLMQIYIQILWWCSIGNPLLTYSWWFTCVCYLPLSLMMCSKGFIKGAHACCSRWRSCDEVDTFLSYMYLEEFK